MTFYQLDPEVTPQAVDMDVEVVEKLAHTFRTAVEEQQLFSGAQLAVFRKGKKVLDLGGGVARLSNNAPVQPETMFTLYSSTKGLAALCMHMLHDKGKFNYEDRVGQYWPEFAQNGKENATITHVLGHRVGNTLGPDWLTHDLWGNRAQCAKAMAEMAPRWTPGEANGYHPLNYGFMLNELMLRLDGRDCGQFFREEVAQPLGLDSLFIGLPASEEARVACVYEAPMDQESLTEAAEAMGITPDEEYFAFQRALDFDADVDPATLAYPELRNIFNRPETHRIVLPAGGGISSARDIAKFYAMVSLGAQWQGKQYLSKETLEFSITPTNTTEDIDRSLRLPIIYGQGWMLGHLAQGATLRTFGHPGKGGQVCLADLDRQLSIAFLNTGQQDHLGFFQFSNTLVELALAACQ